MMLAENELPLFERPAAAIDVCIYIYIYILLFILLEGSF